MMVGGKWRRSPGKCPCCGGRVKGFGWCRACKRLAARLGAMHYADSRAEVRDAERERRIAAYSETVARGGRLFEGVR